MRLISVTVKVHFEDNNGKPKNRKESYLVMARDFKHAMEIVTEEFKGTGEHWEFANIQPSRVVSVLNFDGGHKLTGSSKSDTVEEKVLT